MEYAPHGSLMGILQHTDKPLPWPLRLKFATDIGTQLLMLRCLG